jgi:hypothetical protein
MTRAVPAKTARYVGAYEDHLGLRTTETPFSSPVEGNRIAWGTVIEPPNVTATQANELEKREARPSRSRAISACGMRATSMTKVTAGPADLAIRIIF